jgi:hypothetical protein
MFTQPGNFFYTMENEGRENPNQFVVKKWVPVKNLFLIA